jgi:predicted TIM-barrel fold metal-dependent hydrolase
VHVFDAQAPVVGSHYQPHTASLADIEALAQAHGNGHLVLVQPSVYGHNNSLLLKALHTSPGRHRGVVVLGHSAADGLAQLTTDGAADRAPDAAPEFAVQDVAARDVAAHELAPQDFVAMHAAGVRGVRFNQVSPVGAATSPQDLLLQLAPTLRRLGWHVQWYVHPQHLPALLPLQAQTGLRFVLDHLAGMHAQLPPDDPAWGALASLAAQGAWVKLSGWYRLKAAPPYASLHAHIERVAHLFGERLLWASDWPHTSFAAGAAPPYASQWQPVVDVLGAARAQALRCSAPLALYA